MSNISKIFFWMPTFIWMAVIFGFSSQPSLHASAVVWQDFIIKKSAHLTEYLILGLFLYFSLSHTTRLTKKDRFILVFALGIFYAISDEFHQTFVASRDGRLRDVMIDGTGILGSVALLTYLSSSLR